MNSPCIKVTSPSFSKNPELTQELFRYFPNSILNREGKKYTTSELIDFLQDAEGAIIGLEPIDANILKYCKRLKIIAKYGVALDNIDESACANADVKIGWTAGVNRLSVAELTLGYMLSLCRNIYFSSSHLKSGSWKKDGGVQLSGKTVGIIGVGHIGKEVIRLLKPFSCKILVNDLVDQSEYYRQNNLITSSKEEIYKTADIVTLHTPLTPQTKNLITEEIFRQMKNTTFLINTSRGAVVNQDALKIALKNKIIAGAAIDVYEEEPPTDSEFLSLPNLICTPHIGGNAIEAVSAMGLSAIAHLKKFYNK